jgi:hypothetical protein
MSQSDWLRPLSIHLAKSRTILFYLKSRGMTLASWRVPYNDFLLTKDTIKFNVKSNSFEGRVAIKHEVNKLYTITFDKFIDNKWCTKKTCSNINIKDLDKIIDNYIKPHDLLL